MSPTRLFPSTLHHPQITPLSILDATVTRFAPTGAIFLFPSFPSPTLLTNLQKSFINTLNTFPHFTGQLQWAPFEKGRTHRPIITYGMDADPGVEWSVANHAGRIGELVPEPSERAEGRFWVGDAFNQNEFLSNTPLALHNLKDWKGLSGMTVRITLFDDGYAVGIRMAHCLADAQTLMVFVHWWARACRELSGNQDLDILEKPVFESGLLDAHVRAGIDGPNIGLIKSARELPLHRFDWWKTSDSGYPSVMIPTTENSKPPAEYIPDSLSPSTSAPWTTWDWSGPVQHVRVHFTGSEMDKIRSKASQNVPTENDTSISRLDALLAHIWAAINRARGLATSTENVYLNVTLGARSRVTPPLPNSFIGSPIFLTHICASASEASSPTHLGSTASNLRTTINLFTPSKIEAMLHDAAHEVSPPRLWQGFLGSRHTLVASWLRLGCYEVDFGAAMPAYVHSVIPKMDGCVQVMDGGDAGVDLAVYLDGEVMRRFMEDSLLCLKGENV